MGFNSQTGTRTLTLTGTNTGNNTLAAIIGDNSGATSLTKSGAGTWILSGANTYTGLTTVSAGILDLQNSSALGTGTTTVTSGAAVHVDGSGLSIAEPVTLNGTGISNGGAPRNLANSNTWSGAITLGSASRINSDAFGTFTLTGGITGTGLGLTVGGAGDTTISTTGIN